MAEYDASIRINTNISLDKMNSYEINTESLEILKENIERMRRVLLNSFDIQATRMSMEILNQNIQESLKKLSSVFMQYNYDDLLKDIRFTVPEMAEKIGMKQNELFQNMDFRRLFRDSFYQEKYDEARNAAFEYADNEVETEEDISQEELLQIFNEQMEDKIGWQEKLYNK